MCKVIVRENNVESALRKLKQKGIKEGFITEQRKRVRYKKPSVVRVEKRKEAVCNEKKRQRVMTKVWGF